MNSGLKSAKTSINYFSNDKRGELFLIIEDKSKKEAF